MSEPSFDKLVELHQRLVIASDQNRVCWERTMLRSRNAPVKVTFSWTCPSGVVKVTRNDGEVNAITDIYDRNGVRVHSFQKAICADLHRAATDRYDRQVAQVINAILLEIGEAP